MSTTFPASAIIWTNAKPAYQGSGRTNASADIHAVQLWIERERDLAKFRQRTDNWDGFESSAPDQAILNRAVFFLRTLQERNLANPPMRVALAPDGSVAFEWLEGASFVRAEVEDSDEVEWMVAVPGQATRFQVECLARSEPKIEQSEALPGSVANFKYAVAG
jgi:hypothetical protein